MKRHASADDAPVVGSPSDGVPGMPRRGSPGATLPRRHQAPRCNFFLVGAPKAGTTSIDRLLRGHPDVYLSPIKEPCHFCPDVAEQLAPSFRKKQHVDIAAYLASRPLRELGLAWVSSADDYARLFEDASGQRIVGECSTFYLSSAEAPARIHAYNPDARIVAILRRPIDRIRSHYEMDRVHGVTGRSLSSLVEEELALGDGAHWGNSAYYVGASRYARQLQAYRRHFAPEQICVLSFERLLADPDRELRRLHAFLGIGVPAERLALPSANRARTARFPVFNHALHASGFKSLLSGTLKRAMPARWQAAAKSAYYRSGGRTTSDGELAKVERLLREAGLADTPVLDATAA